MEKITKSMSMKPEELKKAWKGIIPVQICPYGEDRELNVEGLRKNTKFLADFAKEGRDVIILTNGSTTSFYANTIEEQKTLIKNVVRTSEDVPVVAGTSQAGTRKTIEMTRYAEDIGADGAMVVPPYYHTPTKEGMFQHYKEIADSTNIGIIVYNNADVSGAWITPDLLKKISKIENIVGLKENTYHIPHIYEETRIIDQKDMSLVDGIGYYTYVAKASFGMRFRGFVNGVGNFAPSLVYEVYEEVKKGNFKKAYNKVGKIDPFWNCVKKFMEKRETTSIAPELWRANYMYQSAIKKAMDLVGLNGGPVRLPMVDITDEEGEKIREALEEMNVL